MYLYFFNVLSRQDELSSRQVKNLFGRLVWRVALDSYLDGRKSLFETFDFIICAYNYYSCTVHDEVGFEWREQGNWSKNTLCFMKVQLVVFLCFHTLRRKESKWRRLRKMKKRCIIPIFRMYQIRLWNWI